MHLYQLIALPFYTSSTSANYPNNYEASTNQQWYIEVPLGQHVQLTITDFHVGQTIVLHPPPSPPQTENNYDSLSISWDVCQFGFYEAVNTYTGQVASVSTLTKRSPKINRKKSQNLQLFLRVPSGKCFISCNLFTHCSDQIQAN